MKLRRPKGNQGWDPFWGCNSYPNCDGTREILPDGRPETDEDYFDDWEELSWL